MGSSIDEGAGKAGEGAADCPAELPNGPAVEPGVAGVTWPFGTRFADGVVGVCGALIWNRDSLSVTELISEADFILFLDALVASRS